MWHFIKENYRWIGGAFLLTYFSSFGQTFFIAGSVGEWQSKFELSHGEFSQLFMIATLASALTLPFLGRIVDVVPERRVILLSVTLLAVGCVLAATAPSVILLTFALYLLRLFGQGMMTHIAFTSVGKWFAAQRGRAMSLVMIGHHAGGFSLPHMYTAITLSSSWQSAWIRLRNDLDHHRPSDHLSCLEGTKASKGTIAGVRPQMHAAGHELKFYAILFSGPFSPVCLHRR